MKLKSILVISIIAAIILIIEILPVKPNEIPPEMTDRVEVFDETTVELGVIVSESLDFSEETIIDENNVEFYIDENGVKHYFIEEIDIPQLED